MISEIAPHHEAHQSIRILQVPRGVAIMRGFATNREAVKALVGVFGESYRAKTHVFHGNLTCMFDYEVVADITA